MVKVAYGVALAIAMLAQGAGLGLVAIWIFH